MDRITFDLEAWVDARPRFTTRPRPQTPEEWATASAAYNEERRFYLGAFDLALLELVTQRNQNAIPLCVAWSAYLDNVEAYAETKGTDKDGAILLSERRLSARMTAALAAQPLLAFFTAPTGLEDSSC